MARSFTFEGTNYESYWDLDFMGDIYEYLTTMPPAPDLTLDDYTYISDAPITLTIGPTESVKVINLGVVS